jgi:stage II sporulation protein D
MRSVFFALAILFLLAGCGRAPNNGDDTPLIAAANVTAPKHQDPPVIEGPPTLEIPPAFKKDWDARYAKAPKEEIIADIAEPPAPKTKIRKIKHVRIIRVGQQTFTPSPVAGRAPVRNYLPLKVQTSTASTPVTPPVIEQKPTTPATPSQVTPDAPVTSEADEKVVVQPDRSRSAIWVHVFPVFTNIKDDEYDKSKKFGGVVLKATGGESGGEFVVARLRDGVALTTAQKISFDLEKKKMILDDKYQAPLTAYHVVPGPSTVVQVCDGKDCHSYRGTFVVSYETDTQQAGCPVKNSKNSNNGRPYVRVVNVVDLEDYLLGVVPAEMPSGEKNEKKAFYTDEALRAQSVAARTYAAFKMLNNKDWKASAEPITGCVDAQATTSDQQYTGFDIETERATKSIQATEGKLLYYQRHVIQANFHSNSGGLTRSAGDWEADRTGKQNPQKEAEFAYLKPVPELDVEAVRKVKPGQREKGFAPLAMTNALHSVKIKFADKEIASIKVTDRNSSGRVLALEIAGSTDKVVLQDEVLRSFLTRLFGANYYGDNIQKTGSYFDVALENTGLVKFKIYGYGHRVGMSQVGAGVLSQHGRSSDDILHFYYSPSVDIL